MIVCCGTSFFRGGCDATLFLGSYGWSASLYVCVDRRRCIRTGGGGLLFEGDGVPAPFNQACTTPCTLAGIASWTEMGWETVPYTYDTFDWVWDPSLVWFDFFGNQYIGAYEYRTVTHTGMMTLPVTVTLVQPIYSKCPACMGTTSHPMVIALWVDLVWAAPGKPASSRTDNRTPSCSANVCWATGTRTGMSHSEISQCRFRAIS